MHRLMKKILLEHELSLIYYELIHVQFVAIHVFFREK